MGSALLLVDLINDFSHEDGAELLESFRRRRKGMVAALEDARARGLPVVYANDNQGVWDGDAPGLVRRAVEEGRGGDVIAALAPRAGDRFVVKPRYSAFDHTALVLILRSLEVDHLLLAGAATEMCVLHTAIDAQQRGYGIAVLADACASIQPENERVALAYIEDVLGLEVRRGSREALSG
jgi:nicotinamidase-related amidase